MALSETPGLVACRDFQNVALMAKIVKVVGSSMRDGRVAKVPLGVGTGIFIRNSAESTEGAEHGR